MAKQDRSITAAELMKQLNDNSDWVRRNAEREAAQAARAAQLRVELEPEEKPLLEELAQVGWPAQSVWEFVNCRGKYTEAIPVLAKALVTVRHPVLREGIIRSLGVPEARGVADVIILHQLLNGNDPAGSEIRWVMANALTGCASVELLPEIEKLVADPRFEDVRDRLDDVLRGLRRRKASGKYA